MGGSLLEVVLVIGLLMAVVGGVARFFSSTSMMSSAIGNEQMVDEETQRLLLLLRSDCRSAKEVTARLESLELIKFYLDQGGNVMEKPVSYAFKNGVITRQEGTNSKNFEFSRYLAPPCRLRCVFQVASPTIVFLELEATPASGAAKKIIDVRIPCEGFTGS